MAAKWWENINAILFMIMDTLKMFWERKRIWCKNYNNLKVGRIFPCFVHLFPILSFLMCLHSAVISGSWKIGVALCNVCDNILCGRFAGDPFWGKLLFVEFLGIIMNSQRLSPGKVPEKYFSTTNGHSPIS